MQSRNYTFDVLSKYRPHLMGVAAVGIILCHAAGNGVRLPYVIGYIFGFGNLGVDLFLLLSGFGLYNSLKNSLQTSGTGGWWSKRFLRLLVPYLILSVPYWVYICKLEGRGIEYFLYYVSTIVFWFEHRGAWFVALIIPLYLLAPLIYRICIGKNGIVKLFLLIIAICIISEISSDSYTWGNIVFALERTPFFFLGFVSAKLAEEGVKIKYRNVVIISFCMFSCSKLLRLIDIDVFWLSACPILWIVTLIMPILFELNFLNKILLFMEQYH